MPAKMDRCVSKIMKQGKNKKEACAICSKSTGIKKAKGGKWKKDGKTVKESIDNKTTISNLITAVFNKNYSEANKHLQTAIDEMMEQRVQKLLEK